MKLLDIIKTIKQEKILLFNLVFRLLLALYVCLNKNYLLGDSLDYLHWALKICEGDFIGDVWRMPLYEWFVSLTTLCSIKLNPNQNVGRDLLYQNIASSVFALTILVWICGAYIYLWLKKQSILNDRKAKFFLIFFLFDPAFLAYSNFFMSDVLFGLMILLHCFFLYREIISSSKNKKNFILMNLFLILTFYSRNPGFVVALMTFLTLFLLVLLKQYECKKFLLSLLIFTTLITPRFFMVHQKARVWAFSTQGGAWIQTVAAAVYYDNENLSFFEAEKKWFETHQKLTTKDAVNVFIDKPFTWLKLTIKGMLRVFLGHVNVEWGRIFTGKSVIGPGFFKKPEGGEGSPLEKNFSIKLFLWILGMTFTLIYYCYFYFLTFKNLIKKNFSLKEKLFLFWIFTVTLLLSFMPMIFGDSRFRIPFWGALVFSSALYFKASNKEDSANA